MPPARLLITAVRTASCEIVVARGAAGVDQPCAAHVAVGDLVAREIDRMIGGQLGVDALVGLAVRIVLDVERVDSRRCSRAASA